MKLSKADSKRIRDSARGEDCALRIPGICNHQNETVVLCHAPYPGRGGTRLHDWWAAYGCSACHDVMDGRHGTRLVVPTNAWLHAIHETQEKLIGKGLIRIGK